MYKRPSKYDQLIFAKVKNVDRMRVEQQAQREGLTISDIVRRAVLRDLRRLEAQSA